MALFEDRKLLLLLLRVCLVLFSLLKLSELSLLWYLSPSELNRSTVELLTNVCNVRFNARICRFFRFSFPLYLVTTLCLRSGWFGSIEIFSWFITPGSVATNEAGTHLDVSLKTCSGFTSLTVVSPRVAVIPPSQHQGCIQTINAVRRVFCCGFCISDNQN